MEAVTAKREGRLVLYTSAPVQMAQKLLERFEQATGIKGELFYQRHKLIGTAAAMQPSATAPCPSWPQVEMSRL